MVETSHPQKRIIGEIPFLGHIDRILRVLSGNDWWYPNHIEDPLQSILNVGERSTIPREDKQPVEMIVLHFEAIYPP